MIILIIMEDKSAEKNLHKALSLVREGNTLEALFFLDKLIDDSDDPVVTSSYALCIALERGKVKDAIDICMKALNNDPENPYHYLNLGKIYLKGKEDEIAVDFLRKGLQFSGESKDSEEIKEILDRLDTRKKPVFPFLHRDHFLNNYFGLILSRLRLR